MPTIGVLEGVLPSRRILRPVVMLGRDYDLVSAFPSRSFRRSQSSFLRGDDPGTLSVTASIGAGAGRAMDALYNNGRNAALAAGRSDAEAAAAGQAAVDAYKATIVMSAQSRIAQNAAEGEVRRLRSIAPAPTNAVIAVPVPIDDYQGIHPAGNRGGSGSVPGPASYMDPTAPTPAPIPIDTRGNSTGDFTVNADGSTTPAAPAGKSGIMLPLLAVAAYYMFK